MSSEAVPKRALVIVDVQRGFAIEDNASTVSAIVDFARRESDRYAIVVATQFVNRPGSLYETERDWHDMMSGDDIDLLPDVASVADVVIVKQGLAPEPAGLVQALRDRGVNRVDLCGFDTDQCVLATALLLWDAGIAPRVLAELCSSSGGPDMHEAGLAITRRATGDRNVVDVSGRPM